MGEVATIVIPPENEILTDGLYRAHIDELQAERFERIENGKPTFTMLVSDEIHRHIKDDIKWWISKVAVRHSLIQARANSLENLDSVVNMDSNRRTVQSFSQRIEAMIDMSIVVKGRGKDTKEDFIKEYQRMRALSLASPQILTDEEQDLIEFCPVYAVITGVNPEGEKEDWLFMKKIPKAHWTSALDYKEGEKNTNLHFSVEQHPDLARIFATPEGSFLAIKENITKRGLDVSDIFPGNLLWTQDQNGKKHYTIIDQR